MERFSEGTRVRITGTFAPVQTPTVFADPSGAVSIAVRRPDGSISNPPADRLAAGVFGATVLLDAPGRWAIRISSAGEAVTEQEFYVEPSVVK